MTDQEIDDLLSKLDGIARDRDQYEYGLPIDQSPSATHELMREAVRASISAPAPQPVGIMSRATIATGSGAGYKEVSLRFADLEDAEQVRKWAVSCGAQPATHRETPAPSAAGELPPLPEPRTLSRGDDDGAIQLGYTSDQMRAYARAASAPQPDRHPRIVTCPGCEMQFADMELHDANMEVQRLRKSQASSVGHQDTTLLRQALEALEYHREQTRPIERTGIAIAALRQRLAAAPEGQG